MSKKKTNRETLKDLKMEIIIVGDDENGELKETLETKLVEDIGGRLEDEKVTIGQDVLKTINGVCVEYMGQVPSDHVEQVERFINDFLYESETIEIETWRIDEELKADPEINRLEAQRRAVVQLGHLRFLESLDYEAEYFEKVAVSPNS